MSLARLWRDQGRWRASCSLRFTAGSRKGFDTRDLKDAKALLEMLSS